MFRFKQFNIDQTGCAMKINTDGVLLGAMAKADEPKTILDIGTGTGVIALMLAQRYSNAIIDAVEIDSSAAATADRNFKNSIFRRRLRSHSADINEFDKQLERKYDLIVSNPPFYINSLKSPGLKTNLAKHIDTAFLERLISKISVSLSPPGKCWLVLPTNLRERVIEYAEEGGLYIQDIIAVRSYPESAPHRMILSLSAIDALFIEGEITIYDSKGVYSGMYRSLLQPYFIAF